MKVKLKEREKYEELINKLNFITVENGATENEQAIAKVKLDNIKKEYNKAFNKRKDNYKKQENKYLESINENKDIKG